MRLCTINSGGKPAVGVKMGDGKVIDLSKQMPRGPKSVVEILAGGKKLQQAVLKACAKPKAGATVSEKSARYLAPIPNPGSRRGYLRVQLETTGEGTLGARLTGEQGSAILRSMVAADGLAVIQPDTTVAPGETVEVIVLRELP